MPRAAPRGRTSRVTRPAAIAAGNTHRRHWAASARPGGTGEDVRILTLLPDARRPAGRDVTGARRPGHGHLDWLYSDTRRAAGLRAAATLATYIRACQAPRATSSTGRMITDSTLSAAMPSGQRQLPTSP